MTFACHLIQTVLPTLHDWLCEDHISGHLIGSVFAGIQISIYNWSMSLQGGECQTKQTGDCYTSGHPQQPSQHVIRTFCYPLPSIQVTQQPHSHQSVVSFVPNHIPSQQLPQTNSHPHDERRALQTRTQPSQNIDFRRHSPLDSAQPTEPSNSHPSNRALTYWSLHSPIKLPQQQNTASCTAHQSHCHSVTTIDTLRYIYPRIWTRIKYRSSSLLPYQQHTQHSPKVRFRVPCGSLEYTTAPAQQRGHPLFLLEGRSVGLWEGHWFLEKGDQGGGGSRSEETGEWEWGVVEWGTYLLQVFPGPFKLYARVEYMVPRLQQGLVRQEDVGTGVGRASWGNKPGEVLSYIPMVCGTLDEVTECGLI